MLPRIRFSVLFLGCLLPGVVPGVVAQEPGAANRIYVATYQVNWGDIPEYMAIYNEVAVPILESLVEEGLLVGFNFRMHHTGGEYNLREGLLGNEDTDFDAAWAAYNGRWAQSSPASSERAGRIIQAHQDEVWNLDMVNLGDGAGQAQYLYEALWQINMSDLGRWQSTWAEEVLPTADQLIEEGLAQGYVIQGHNTGGRFNWKFSWLYDEWDNFNELEARFFAALPLDHPAWEMVMSHKDELWQLPPE